MQQFHLSGSPATLKADHTFVTEADIASNRLINAAIRERFPLDFILSEELQTSLGPDLEARFTWVVDPLDGTTNYALGLRIWGISIARLERGIPNLGVLYFPLLDELYTAQRGQGAHLNDQPIHTRPPDPNRPHAFFTCCSRTLEHYQVNLPYKTRILGSASYSFCMVARGTALIGFEVSPKVWDLAAAWLIVQEAGGVIEPFDGSPPFPIVNGYEYFRRSYPTLAAATPKLQAMARAKILPKRAENTLKKSCSPL